MSLAWQCASGGRGARGPSRYLPRPQPAPTAYALFWTRQCARRRSPTPGVAALPPRRTSHCLYLPVPGKILCRQCSRKYRSLRLSFQARTYDSGSTSIASTIHVIEGRTSDVGHSLFTQSLTYELALGEIAREARAEDALPRRCSSVLRRLA